MKKKLIISFISLIFFWGCFSLLYILWLEQIQKVICYILVIIIICFLYSRTTQGKNLLLYLRGFYWNTKLKHKASKLRVAEKVQILHPECVVLGKSCDIAQNVVFAPLREHNNIKYPSSITVGNNVHFGPFDRIASMNKVIIEDDVLLAAFVHITDHSHDYHDANIPIWKQGVFSKGPVHIKKGAWLAFGCHVLSGVTIGEHSVVAANSVVTKDVPPYTIVAGNPARIISQYNFNSKQWESISSSN